ncbi:MAG: universal stress protein [Burkholderiales bacterium]|nr:universal stress protein [Burkholderiales bacterium]
MKSILVHLDASPRAATRLVIARDLAQAQGAALRAVYAVLPALLLMPWASEDGMAAAAAALAEVDRGQRERARALFERVAGPAASWAEVGTRGLHDTLLAEALCADLLVLGQGDDRDDQTGALPADFVPALITDSGKPALVVPYVGELAPPGRRVLLAWKPTREAARAASAALPWLRGAAEVHLAAPHPEADEAGLALLRRWLALHGVGGRVTVHALGDADVGERLLSLAADTGADLLAMGCYGHSRAREFVLGGATRTVLRAMTLPVLMAH